MDAVTVFDAGPVANWTDHTFTLPGTAVTRAGMQLLGERLGLRGAEISVNVFAPGQVTPICHRHQRNEEVYLFLSGSGEMLLDGKVIPVGEGSCVRLSPAVARAWRNTGAGPLTFVVIQYPQRDDVPHGIADGVGAAGEWPRR